MQNAIAVEPVSIAVDAANWQHYTSGIFNNCGTSLDHGVIAVGYTSTYWYVRNSWGTGWGQSGYIQLAAGNTCGLLNSASYPTV
jgi:C1A family cysteine protease